MPEHMKKGEIVFVDTEIDPKSKKILDIGAIRANVPVYSENGVQFHENRLEQLRLFMNKAVFVCGHNIIKFDLRYIFSAVEEAGVRSVIDTLFLSPLLFPQYPYHRLLKNDKLQSDELNNPLNDARKAMGLFIDEVSAFNTLSLPMRITYCSLLEMKPEFRGFFRYVNFHQKTNDIGKTIRTEFKGKICEDTDITKIAEEFPIELAYCLATISVGDRESIIPFWVQKSYPKVQQVYRMLRGLPCKRMCAYCSSVFNIHAQLGKKFGYKAFREYNGEPLQEKAVQAAVDGSSLLAIFPTGGGKSITFQLPALMAAEATHGLTVVISPLQSLMKDQVDNLNKQGITDAVTINGLLNVVERAEALDRIESGIASILYISPESLRSKTIERLLLGRTITRFVIDEAHCFSSWGQDFRVDYLYIGDYIAELQEKKQTHIPVSCFTATAKQKVISDIKVYFRQKLNIELELYTTNATRSNLRYEVLNVDDDNEKYSKLRDLIEQKDCPTIVYASRTKKTVELADKLCSDGFNARAFHGKMSSDEKIKNQEDFICGEVQIIVATSAFGMGVDKKDVKLVVHYDISDSLENYVQEAGRAGRDENIQADCYVLFNKNDLDKHFILLNQTKLSINEIQQVWKGIKGLTKNRKKICCSALEIARQAGWDENGKDIETKVKTAISSLELAGYIKRGQNCPRVYADSIQVKTAQEAISLIQQSKHFDEMQRDTATRIIKKLISCRSRAAFDVDEAECRVDYIADHLGIEKRQVIESVNLMREEGILANDKEMSVLVETANLKNRAKSTRIDKYLQLEEFLLEKLQENGVCYNYKEVNEEAINRGIKSSTVSGLRLLMYFWIIKGYIKKPEGEINVTMQLVPQDEVKHLKARYDKRRAIVQFVENYFVSRAQSDMETFMEKGSIIIHFSIQELQRAYDNEPKWFQEEKVTLHEMEEALLYLSKISAFRIEGGFLVIYNGMEITRLELDNKIRYKVEDYKQLQEFYNSKTQQIHIVGEYAHMMVSDYQAALTFVNDYFQMDYKLFLTKYFEGARQEEINKNITPMKYQMLFENLSDMQSEIIGDDTSKVIVVAAGPGSGKTKILVHKLASLMLLEDVKHEQLLMLTFSRAAVLEFKRRLADLIGNAAYFIEIKTFHSYCFDLLGKIGDIENSQNVVHDATNMIRSDDVELDRITKTVLVLDEAQDMDEDEFQLILALMERNEEMRVIAVGDDDQNIYEFRHSNSKYMESLLKQEGARKYELNENFRSSRRIVGLANAFIKLNSKRLKTRDIVSAKQEEGEVILIKNASSLETAIVRQIERNWEKCKGKNVAVLTITNEQAYLITELLNKKGYNAKLIQSNDRFSLCDLIEMRFFLDQIRIDESPAISIDIWEQAKRKLQKAYRRSENLRYCMNLLEQFESTTSKKYYSDFVDFLKEVHFEDFYSSQKGEICVSTIHKSKGREFDWVYMLLNQFGTDDDAARRRIYVGITRAKDKLCIFHNTSYFDSILGEMHELGIGCFVDNHQYPIPEEIALYATLSDVWLSYANADSVTVIEKLQSGDLLQLKEETLSNETKLCFLAEGKNGLKKVGYVSKDFYKQILQQRKRGYELSEARVRFVVKWHDKVMNKENTIILPVIKMRKPSAI